MKIEYDYIVTPSNENIKQEMKRLKREETIGCLIGSLILLVALFIIISLLPFILFILGWLIIFIAAITIYKMYFESAVLNFIQKRKMKK